MMVHFVYMAMSMVCVGLVDFLDWRLKVSWDTEHLLST